MRCDRVRSVGRPRPSATPQRPALSPAGVRKKHFVRPAATAQRPALSSPVAARTRTTAAGVSPCVVNVNRQVGWC